MIELPEVAGHMMERSIDDFVRACKVKIMEEQEKVNCDTPLIAVLCDAVRLTREYTKEAKEPINAGCPTPREAELETAVETGIRMAFSFGDPDDQALPEHLEFAVKIIAEKALKVKP